MSPLQGPARVHPLEYNDGLGLLHIIYTLEYIDTSYLDNAKTRVLALSVAWGRYQSGFAAVVQSGEI